jgi:hypothetical protein
MMKILLFLRLLSFDSHKNAKLRVPQMIRDHLRGVLHIKKRHLDDMSRDRVRNCSFGLAWVRLGSGQPNIQSIAPCGIGRNNIAHYPNPLPISCAKRMAWRMPRIFSMEGRIF